MAVSASVVKHNTRGAKRSKLVDVTFDASYPTGGEALLPSQVGLTVVDKVLGSASGYTFEYNSSTSKLLAYVSGGTEVTNTTDLSALVARLEFIGN